MSRRVRPKRSDSFESEVRRQFGILAVGWELEGPIEGGVVLPTVNYRAGRLTYTWMFDNEDRRLVLSVALSVAGGRRSGFLDDLVAGAGLGAPQDVRTSAQTWHSLQQSIASHIGWLRRLHPLLAGPDAEVFLERAGARLVPRDG